jgi:hypothetical protein
MKLPRYDDAACIGHAEIMDGNTLKDVISALALCNSCPILTPCETFAKKYARNAHDKVMHGVIGGRLYGHTRRFRKGVKTLCH